MEWTMPRPVLNWVAGLLGAAALGAFVMGIVNAPDRGGRLPGERAPGQAAGPATVINATEATPLAQERLEAPAAPKPAAKATNTAEDEEDAAAPNLTNVIPPAKATNVTPVTPPPAATNTTPATPPPEEEPPH